MDIGVLIQQLSAFTVGVAALGWLSRTIIIHFLDKDAASFQTKLQHSHDLEIERLRNDTRLKSIEHEIRFRKMHEKQAEVLAQTYKRIVELYRAVASYVAVMEWPDEPAKEEKLKLVSATHTEFRSYFYPNLIFFPKSTGNEVKHLGDKLVKVSNTFSFGEKMEKAGRVRPDSESDHWDKTAEIMENEVPPLLEKIQEDFQRLLGVSGTNR